MLIYNDAQWQRFLAAIGQPERFTQDVRLSNQANRSRHIHEVYGFVSEVMQTRTTREWVGLDIPNQVPASLDDLLEGPHLRATGLVGEEL